MLSSYQMCIKTSVEMLNTSIFRFKDCIYTNLSFQMLIGNENKAALTREVSLIRERLRAIEAESGFLKHAAMTLQSGDEGSKLLTEIAQHLRELRHRDTATEVADA